MTENSTSSNEIVLTDEQWQKVKDLWNSRPTNPPSLMELTKAAFDKPDLDGRTKEGRAVRKKLAEANIKVHTTEYNNKGLIELTEDQKDFIRNNYTNMKSVEMAKVLFNVHNLTNLNQETRTVISFVRSLDSKRSFENPDSLVTGEYSPPRTLQHALGRINRYTNQDIQEAQLTGKQKKDITSLIGFLSTCRFKRQINIYEKEEDRELFESTFIRYTYDKNDLTEEEVDQYVVLATEVVKASVIQVRGEVLRKMLDESTEGDGKDRKISMALVEAIEKSETEYNQCIIRQQRLLESLKVKRSEKEGKSKTGAASVLNLVEAWKFEEGRKKMIRLAQLQKEKLKRGIDELQTIDELKARIYGLTIEEALNG